MSTSKTVYDRLGDDNLRLLVNKFYAKVFVNPVIGPLFANSDQELVKEKQFCFLTQFLGGPPRFNETFGFPRMRKRHMPHAIDNTAKEEWLRLMKESIYELPIEQEFQHVLYQCFPTLAAHMVNR